jgi:response regulator RpfG family c-di-GMP phosphodiesterase
VRTQLELKHARDLLRDQNVYLEAEVARRMRDILDLQDITINALAELAETRDPETGNHIRRTQEYVRILATRLMALADVFAALISRRVYKAPMPVGEARDIIASERGHHFDPDVVDAFLASFPEFVAIAEKYRETD